MVLISHRGNTVGPNKLMENKPEYIVSALKEYNVEIDLWVNYNNELYLGHDFGQYRIDQDFLNQDGLWIHCKNIKALEYLKDNNIKNPYFWHQDDDTVLTSNCLFWAYPGKELTKWSIAVLPEVKEFRDLNIAYGICSDYIKRYSK